MNKRRKLWIVSVCLVSAVALMGIWGCGKKTAPTHEAEYDVIIIGAGMGGLSAGAHLASSGLKVLVLEQHHKVGGCTTNFTRGDYTFEVALHELAGGGLIDLMELCGVRDKVEIYDLPDFYRSVYPGDPGVDITMPTDWEGWDNTLKEQWPEEAEGIDKFHELCTTVFADIMGVSQLFRYSGFEAFTKKMSVPIKHKALVTWSKSTLEDLMDECFTDEYLKAVVYQLWVYYGAPVPDQTSLLTLAATEVFLTDGVKHIMGTSQALSNAYAERIEELGSDVITGTLVTEIIIEDGIAKGVVTEYGDVYTGRYVICNTDPFQMIYTLIGEENLPAKYVEKIAGMEVANSLFVSYLGLNVDLKALGYDDTEIFYSTTTDTEVLYDNMMSANFAEGMVCITVYTNYGDPIYAPPGKSVVAVLEYSDYDSWPKDPEEYQVMKEEKAWEMLELAANVIPELADPKNIEIMEVMTPVTLAEFTKNYHGIPYGFYADLDQWEKIPHATPIDNVYIASNWTRVWHGVGPAQINGWMAARLIMDVEGIE